LIGGFRVPTSDAGADTESIEGLVRHDDRPVPDAIVRVKGTGSSTRTNEEGRFQLSIPKATPPERFVVTAAKTGYFIAGKTATGSSLEIDLEPHPTADCESYAWVDPTPDASSAGNCGNCHRQIYDEWITGTHASSATGIRLRNLYEGTDRAGQADRGWNLLADYPEGAGVCLSCHAPSAPVDELAIGDLREVSGVARHGVHCDFCHKIQDVHSGDVGVSHGRFGLKLLRPSTGQLFFGPLDDVDRGEDVHSRLQSRSEVCAACHEGIVFGVPVYETYSEWLTSPAAQRGQQCQSCHMKPTGRMTNFAPGAGGMDRDPLTLASHSLYPEGKAAMLRNSLRLTTKTDVRGEHIDLEIVIVPRNVGHRVPTGFVDRHLLLVVEAWDGHEQAVSITGPELPPFTRSNLGPSGQLFAKQLIGENGVQPIPFWQVVDRIVDTRLEPEREHRAVWRVPHTTRRIRVRLIYRHFWEQVAIEKKWSDNEILVHEEIIPVDQ
jgi:hypothetical protein